MVPRPIRTPRAEDLELEGEDAVHEPGAGGGRVDGVEDVEEVGAFGRGLVEEAQARECGEAKVPELARASR